MSTDAVVDNGDREDNTKETNQEYDSIDEKTLPARTIPDSKSQRYRAEWTQLINVQCKFFLWMEHDADARKWLDKSQHLSYPQTPMAVGACIGQLSQPTISGTTDQDSESQIARHSLD